MGARSEPARNHPGPSGEAPKLERLDGDAAESALDLDRLIHERARLGMVSVLAVNGTMTFTELRDQLGVTDGNLSAHARKLEDAGYVVCHKSFEGRTPRTEYELTRKGRTALAGYLDHMEAIIQLTRQE